MAVTKASGNSLAINTYDEYGIPSLSNLGRFAYTGQIYLPDLKLYHYKACIYSPTLGRFLQTDPIGYQDQINLGDANMRSVWICSRNDAIGNIAVVLATAGVFGTGTAWPDLIVAAIMAGSGIFGGVQIIRQARAELRDDAGNYAAIPGE